MGAPVKARPQWPKGTRPRRRWLTVQMYAASARTRLDCHLQVLGRAERDLLAGLYFDSFAGRWISPHAGCACPDLQNAKTGNADALAFFEMLGDQAHEVAENSLARAFREFVIRCQPCRTMLERNGTARLGTCRRFARHDGCPPQRREMRDAKRYDSRLEGKQLSTCMLRSRTLGRLRRKRDVAVPNARICGHFGIDPGTKQNRNGNIVPVLRA